MLNVFICEYCGETFFARGLAQAHEQTCACNPKNSNNTISARPSGSTIITYPSGNMVPYWMVPHPTPQ